MSIHMTDSQEFKKQKIENALPSHKIIKAFFCYRRNDGGWYADWLHQILNDFEFIDAKGDTCKLSVYYDKTAPGVSNWKELHFPSLQTAHSLIFICTPGAAKDLQESDSPDWVYEELRWWMKNRSAAPIIVDTTGEGQRWLPAMITKRWPDINRIELRREDADVALAKEDNRFKSRINQRLIDSIVLSERSTVFDDLERFRKLSAKLKVTTVVLGLLLGVAIVLSAMAAIYARRATDGAMLAATQASIAETRRAETIKTLEWVFNRTALLPFDAITLDFHTEELVEGIVTRLRNSSYTGKILLSGRVGQFVVIRHKNDDVELATNANRKLLAKGDTIELWPGSREYSLAIGQKIGDSVARFIQSRNLMNSDDMLVVSVGKERPTYKYPENYDDIDKWNEIAAKNNGVFIELEDKQ